MPLDKGKHEIKLITTDLYKNKSETDWKFEVSKGVQGEEKNEKNKDNTIPLTLAIVLGIGGITSIGFFIRKRKK